MSSPYVLSFEQDIDTLQLRKFILARKRFNEYLMINNIYVLNIFIFITFTGYTCSCAYIEMTFDGICSYTIPVIVGGITIVGIWIWNRSKQVNGLPPGPFVWPFFGHLPQVMLYGKRPMFQVAMEWRKKYGDVFLMTLGAVRLVWVSGIEKGREVLIERKEDFDYRPSWLTLTRETKRTEGKINEKTCFLQMQKNDADQDYRAADLCICFRHIDTNPLRFKPETISCGSTAGVVSDLVGNHEGRFFFMTLFICETMISKDADQIVRQWKLTVPMLFAFVYNKSSYEKTHI